MEYKELLEDSIALDALLKGIAKLEIKKDKISLGELELIISNGVNDECYSDKIKAIKSDLFPIESISNAKNSTNFFYLIDLLANNNVELEKLNLSSEALILDKGKFSCHIQYLLSKLKDTNLRVKNLEIKCSEDALLNEFIENKQLDTLLNKFRDAFTKVDCNINFTVFLRDSIRESVDPELYLDFVSHCLAKHFNVKFELTPINCTSWRINLIKLLDRVDDTCVIEDFPDILTNQKMSWKGNQIVYTKMISEVFDYLYKRFEKEETFYRFLFEQLNKKQFFMLPAYKNDIMQKHIQKCVHIRVGDLAFVPDIFTMYPPFVLGQLELPLEGGYKVHSYNVALAAKLYSYVPSVYYTPCVYCRYNSLCEKVNFGDGYEETFNLFGNGAFTCSLLTSKVSTLYNKLKEHEVLTKINKFKATKNFKEEELVAIKDYLNAFKQTYERKILNYGTR